MSSLFLSPKQEENKMKILTEFTVRLDKERKIEDVIRASRYDEMNFLIKEGIQKKRLSFQNEEVGKRTVIIIGIDDSMSSNDVLFCARKMGLTRPSQGDAFLVGEQNPNEQIAGPIVFLHNPPYLWSGHSFNLVLDVSRKGRIISFISSGGWWHSGFRFAFRKKR